MKNITQKELLELFDYNDGNLYWKVNRGYHKTKGLKAGTIDYKGYIQISIGRGRLFKAHKLIYLFHTGINPTQIDHINGKRDDNRIENLREATNNNQQHNRGVRKDSKSGIKGILFREDRNKWTGYVGYNSKRHYIKMYDTKEEAINEVQKLRAKLHGEFARNF